MSIILFTYWSYKKLIRFEPKIKWTWIVRFWKIHDPDTHVQLLRTKWAFPHPIFFFLWIINKWWKHAMNVGYKKTRLRRWLSWALCAWLCGIRVLWLLLRFWGLFFCCSLVLLGVELWVMLHTLLHGPELLQTLRALHFLLTIVKTGEGLLKHSPTGTTCHPTQARAIPVNLPTGKNETWDEGKGLKLKCV